MLWAFASVSADAQDRHTGVCARPVYALLPPQSAADTRSYLHPELLQKSSAGCGIKASFLHHEHCGLPGNSVMSHPPVLPAPPASGRCWLFAILLTPAILPGWKCTGRLSRLCPYALDETRRRYRLRRCGWCVQHCRFPPRIASGKKDAKEENKPSFASLQRKEPLRLYRHSGSLRHIVSVDRSRLRDRDDDILPKGSSMMTLIQI